MGREGDGDGPLSTRVLSCRIRRKKEKSKREDKSQLYNILLLSIVINILDGSNHR